MIWGHRKGRPIGLDIGQEAIKMIQVDCGDGTYHLVDCAKHVFSADHRESPELRWQEAGESVAQMLQEGRFRGRDVSMSLGTDLFVQNVRIPRGANDELDKIVRWEAEERVPFDVTDAEVRHLVAGEVRQGDEVRQEIILMAASGEAIQRHIDLAESCRLRLVALAAEPCAMFQWFEHQLRRKEDGEAVNVFVDVGASRTKVVISRGRDILFVKPVGMGGQQFSRAVSRKLDLSYEDAAMLRRQVFRDGLDESSELDESVQRAVYDAIRPELETLAREVSLCIRYFSVTFRGRRAEAMHLLGGEATPLLASELSERLQMPIEPGDPLERVEWGGEATCTREQLAGPEWAIALGLCVR